MTHREYFREFQVSVEQYGVLLVRLEYGGSNTQHGNKGFDIGGALVEGIPECRIEVKSKITKGATVINCNDHKFAAGAMTHLAVVLIDPVTYEVGEAWLLTRATAEMLRTTTAYRYIPVKSVRGCSEKKDTTSKIRDI